MWHSSFIRWLRALLPTFLMTIGALLLTLFIVLSSAGLPPQIIAMIEKELMGQGFPIKIDKIRLEALNGFGFVARQAKVYAPEDLKEGAISEEATPFLEISRLTLDINWIDLLSADFTWRDINKLEIKGLKINYPLFSLTEKENPLPDYLSIENLNATLLLPEAQKLDIASLQFEWEQIQFQFSGSLLLPAPPIKKAQLPNTEPRRYVGDTTKKSDDTWKKSLQQVILSLRELKFKDQKPLLNVHFQTELENWQDSRLVAQLTAPFIAYKGYVFKEIDLKTHYESGVFAINSFHFSDGLGSFNAQGRYTPLNQTLIAQFSSSLRLLSLYEVFVDETPLPYGLKFQTPIKTQAEVELRLNPYTYALAELKVIGNVDSKNIRFAGQQVEELSANFSLKIPRNNPNDFHFFIDKLLLKLPDGSLTGSFMKEESTWRAQCKSSLSLDFLKRLAVELNIESEELNALTVSGTPLCEATFFWQKAQNPLYAPEISLKGQLQTEELSFKDSLCKNTSLSFNFTQKQEEKEAAPLARLLSASLKGDDLVYKETKAQNLLLEIETALDFSSEKSLQDGQLQLKLEAQSLQLSSGLKATDFHAKTKIKGVSLLKHYELGWPVSPSAPKDFFLQLEIDSQELSYEDWQGQELSLSTQLSGPIEDSLFSREMQAKLTLQGTSLAYKGQTFHDISLQAQNEQALFKIQDFSLKNSLGQQLVASGSYEEGLIHFSLESNFYLATVAALIPDDPNVDMHHQRVVMGPKGTLNVSAKGYYNLLGEQDYQVTGVAKASDFLYNHVPLEAASCAFESKPGITNIFNPELVFLYDTYALLDKTRYSPRPKKGTLKAEKISHDIQTGVLTIKALSGQAYPEPLLNMFAPHVGQILQTIRFHAMPYLTANGQIDILNPDQRNLDLKVLVRTPKNGQTDYDFLNGTLQVKDLKSTIHLLKNKVTLYPFTGNIWEGRMEGHLSAYIAEKEGYEGNFIFQGCDLKPVGETYKVNFGSARTNAYAHFNMPGHQLNDLKAKGRIELTEGNLLSIPFFGPLSPLFDSVFGFIPGVGNLMGSKINQASCNFNIEKGFFKTQDFLAQGKNINIKGNAAIDLEKSLLNMNIRVDLKSLIGLILSPITLPFGGLFEFHGQGPLMTPKWSINPFSGDHKAQKAESSP